MRIFEVVEGYQLLPPIDKEKYQERAGLEGPFMTRSGKVVYYDPKEGAYYDPNTDMYLSYEDWKSLDETTIQQELSALRSQKLDEFRRVPVPPEHNIVTHLTTAANEFGVDVSLAYAIADKESGGTFDNRLVGDKHLNQKAYGAMQVRQPALSDFNQTYGTEYTMKDLNDPLTNARVGVGYLAMQRDRYGANDSTEMAAMYNGGPKAVTRQNTNALAYASDVVNNRQQRYTPAADMDPSGIPNTTAQSPSLQNKQPTAPEISVRPQARPDAPDQSDAETNRLRSTPAPTPTTTTPTPTTPTTYKIQSGDNLTRIARRNGVTIADIMRSNPQIKDPNKIYAGKSLIIPR